MPNPLTRWLRRRRYGDDVVVVSGLPRSGTSMMMKMLESAGLEIMSDGVREADEDNPKGYYEYERVKDLGDETDKSWVAEARGKVIKVISHLLKDLPDDCFYRVLFMRRQLAEVVASQNKMLVRRGEENPIEDEKAVELYRYLLIHARLMMRDAPNFEVLEVEYGVALEDPAGVAAAVNRFFGGRLDERCMAKTVDPALYRNRSGGRGAG